MVSPCSDVPTLGGLSDLGGEAAQRLELDVDAGAIGQDPEAVQTVIVAREHPLVVARLLAQRDEFVRHFNGVPAQIELRSLDCDPVTFDRGGERHRVSTPPSNVQRLLRQSNSPLARRIVARRRREPDEQAYPRGTVSLFDRWEGTLQQRHEARVRAGPDPREPSP